MESQHLKFDGKVDLPHLNVLRDVQHHGGKVDDAPNTGGDETIGDVLSSIRRCRNDPYPSVVVCHDRTKIVHRFDGDPPVNDGDDCPHDVGMRIDQADNLESTTGEPSV